jgi:predicted RNase H-like nuclease
MTWVAGADGFKSGWYVVLANLDTYEWSARVVPSFAALLGGLVEKPSVICVDIPIGLPEHTPPGGRQCDAMARNVLASRRSSVFSPVGRQALGRTTRVEAHRLSTSSGGIGIGAQAWGLAAKLREVDDAMTVERQALVFEVHPEVSFWAMNGRSPMKFSKKQPDGQSERIDVLARNGVPGDFIEQHMRELRSGRDDFLDACAAAWTASRIRRAEAGRFPAAAVCDARGLDMAIWF